MKIALIIATLLLGIFIGTMFSQTSMGQDDQVMSKLEEILDNQDQMFDYLKFIKNRSR